MTEGERLDAYVQTLTRDEVLAELGTVADVWAAAVAMNVGEVDRLLMPITVLLLARLGDLGALKEAEPKQEFRALCADVFRARLERQLGSSS